jgi:predicted dehydrogenase
MTELKIGMIGLDTSHCGAFVENLNKPDTPHHVPGARVVQAFPGGSAACAVSRDRLQGFTTNLRDTQGIRICGSLEEAAKGMDAFLLTSVDGRQHLEQFEALARFGKPVFIDKPLTCSRADARALADLSIRSGVPVFSASSIRFTPGIGPDGLDRAGLQGVETFGPMSLLDDYPAFYWYGIHSVDLLYAHLGRRCIEVTTFHEATQDLIVGRWPEGRLGVVRGLRLPGKNPFGRTLFGAEGVRTDFQPTDGPPAFATMLMAIIEFFRTGTGPIELEETVEEMVFLEAAEQSWRQGGSTVRLLA